jgi:hypothetical protein
MSIFVNLVIKCIKKYNFKHYWTKKISPVEKKNFIFNKNIVLIAKNFFYLQIIKSYYH